MKKYKTLTIIIGTCLLLFLLVIAYWTIIPRYGTIEIESEGVYTGQLRGRNFHGFGTYTSYGYGVSYEGEWKNNLFHGQGTITYANGAQLIGQFENGYLVGMGLTICPDGIEREVDFDTIILGRDLLSDNGCPISGHDCDHDH